VALTPASLRKLRKRLPRGYQTLVATELKGKYSRAMVGHVALGKRFNQEVVEALIRVAERTQRENAKMENAIAQL
jgi:hypothetical protein